MVCRVLDNKSAHSSRNLRTPCRILDKKSARSSRVLGYVSAHSSRDPGATCRVLRKKSAHSSRVLDKNSADSSCVLGKKCAQPSHLGCVNETFSSRSVKRISSARSDHLYSRAAEY